MIKIDNIIVSQSINNGDITINTDGNLFFMSSQDFKEMLAGYIEKKPLKTIEEYLNEKMK